MLDTHAGDKGKIPGLKRETSGVSYQPSGAGNMPSNICAKALTIDV